MLGDRKKTRAVFVGRVQVGGGAPIAIQSMTNTFTQDVKATAAQINRLADAGCEIARVAVPDMEAVRALGRIKAITSLPVIADVHFDYKLAVAAAQNGADGLRINPGNIGGRQKVAKVVDAAKQAGIPIRVGVNAGSLEKELLKKYGGPAAAAMVESALAHVDHIRSLGFDNLKVSLKASDVVRTVEAYQAFSEKSDLPLHVGVTEAGSRYAGTVKSALGIGMLLAQGIGDTIRVSLTGDPVQEMRVAWEILKALGIRRRGVDLISCPTCGRCEVDLAGMVDKVEEALLPMTTPMRVAVMGCVVNGPGEAREADIGVAGGRGKGILFKKGEVISSFPEDKLVEELLSEARKLESEIRAKESFHG